MQSPQTTQRVASTVCVLKSMHEALQFLVHSEQFLHLSSSKRIFSHENLAKMLSKVPTGQMVLHQVRPFLHASTASSTSVTAAMPSEMAERIHTSLW